MNNFERITNMTTRELANFLKEIISCKYCPVGKDCHNFCENELIKWLESEVKNDL